MAVDLSNFGRSADSSAFENVEPNLSQASFLAHIGGSKLRRAIAILALAVLSTRTAAANEASSPIGADNKAVPSRSAERDRNRESITLDNFTERLARYFHLRVSAQGDGKLGIKFDTFVETYPDISAAANLILNASAVSDIEISRTAMGLINSALAESEVKEKGTAYKKAKAEAETASAEKKDELTKARDEALSQYNSALGEAFVRLFSADPGVRKTLQDKVARYNQVAKALNESGFFAKDDSPNAAGGNHAGASKLLSSDQVRNRLNMLLGFKDQAIALLGRPSYRDLRTESQRKAFVIQVITDYATQTFGGKASHSLVESADTQAPPNSETLVISQAVNEFRKLAESGDIDIVFPPIAEGAEPKEQPDPKAMCTPEKLNQDGPLQGVAAEVCERLFAMENQNYMSSAFRSMRELGGSGISLPLLTLTTE